jgi:hypothetical protein
LIANEGNNVVRHPKKARREFSAAVWARDLRGRKPHCINCLTCIVETRRKKALLCIFAQERITA